MNASIFHHIILIASLYTVLFISNYGWGVFASKILKFNLDSLKGCFFYTVWIGWCTTLFVFQLIHLFFAIDWKASCIIYLAGIAFPIGATKNIFAKAKELFAPDNRSLLISFLASISCIAIWVIFRGMKAPENYDSGLYHFNSIRWINSYPMILGLGNLHGRLAFNQTFFIYAASLNFFPYFPYEHTVSNGFLFLLVTSELIWHLMALVEDWRRTIYRSEYFFTPYIFCLFVVIWWTGVGDDISSPTPDLASFFIQLILFLWFIQIITSVREKNDRIDLVFPHFILATTLITIKLSNAIFALALMGACIFYARKCVDRTRPIQRYFLPSIFVFGIFSIWIIRGYSSSGYPFYPASVGGIPFDWAIPRESVKDLASWVYSWARMPEHNPGEVLGNWNWLAPWALRIYTGFKPTVIYPVLSAGMLFVLSIMILLKTRKFDLLYSGWIYFAPIVASILFWFFSAPEPRFANALFFLFLLSSIILFLPRLYDLVGLKTGLLLTENIILIFAILLVQVMYPIVESDLHDRYTEIPKEVLNQKKTDSGLSIYIPTIGDQCWDAPLPCTPSFDPKLRLRVTGDLSSGFTVK